MNSFSSELLLAKTVDDVVWTIAKQAIGKIGYLDCIVYLMDEKGEYLVQRAAHGPKNPIDFDIDNPIKLKKGQGICGSVAQSGEAEIIVDTRKDERYHIDDQSRLSEITVPIILNGEVIGIIDSEHPKANFYTEEDLEILTTLASMAATKIDQARTHENLEKLVEEKTAELSKNYDRLHESYEEIKKSNVEKETLLKEIHHRVKNNLQVISSLLNLQAGQTDDPYVEEVFTDSKNRILSMSAIHEQLYEKSNLAEIDVKRYVREITTGLLVSYNAVDSIKVKYQLDDVFIDLDNSVPLGLILNELVVNVLKHAFPEGAGLLQIKMNKEGDKIVFSVEDNGIGFDISKKRQSLGVELVYTLTSQLQGEIDFISDQNGTRCTIKFPI